MTTQHTPGPWDLDMSEYGATISNGGTIAEIDDTMTDWKANAHLIAAAAALLDIVTAFADWYDNSDGDTTDLAFVAGAARAAIAKAKGQ